MPHIANTYCALCILLMCDDDFSEVHGDEILLNLSFYESDNVCPIRALPYESEEDMRFVYCACAIK